MCFFRSQEMPLINFKIYLELNWSNNCVMYGADNTMVLIMYWFDNTNNGNIKVQRDSHRKYLLPRVDITIYNLLIDGRNFYDQLINDQIKKYNEVRKVMTGKGDYYTTGSLLDYQYSKDHYQLIAVDLSE